MTQRFSGNSQEKSLFSPPCSLDSQEQHNLLTPASDISGYYKLHAVDLHQAGVDIENVESFEGENTSALPSTNQPYFQTPKKRRVDSSLGTNLLQPALLDSQSTNSAYDQNSQATTLSNPDTQEYTPCSNPENVNNLKIFPLLGPLELLSEETSGEIQASSNPWGVLVSMQGHHVYRIEEDKNEVIFGRSLSSDFCLKSKRFSRQHFSIKREMTKSSDKHVIKLTNLAENGTFVSDPELTMSKYLEACLEGSDPNLKLCGEPTKLMPKHSCVLHSGLSIFIMGNYKTSPKAKAKSIRIPFVFLEPEAPLTPEPEIIFSLHLSGLLPTSDNALIRYGIHRKTFRKYIVKTLKPKSQGTDVHSLFKEEHQKSIDCMRRPCVHLARMICYVDGADPYIVEEIGQFGSVGYHRKISSETFNEERWQKIIGQAYTTIRALHREGITHGAVSLAALYFTHPRGSSHKNNVLMTRPIASKSEPCDDLVMLGKACILALSDEELPLGEYHGSENKSELDAADLNCVKACLPNVSQNGIDFVARLLFAQSSLSVSHPWIEPSKLLTREIPFPPSQDSFGISQPGVTLSGNPYNFRDSLDNSPLKPNLKRKSSEL